MRQERRALARAHPGRPCMPAEAPHQPAQRAHGVPGTPLHPFPAPPGTPASPSLRPGLHQATPCTPSLHPFPAQALPPLPCTSTHPFHDVLNVLLRQRGQVDDDARQVDVLALAQGGGVEAPRPHRARLGVRLQHLQRDGAVGAQDGAALLHVLLEQGVGRWGGRGAGAGQGRVRGGRGRACRRRRRRWWWWQKGQQAGALKEVATERPPPPPVPAPQPALPAHVLGATDACTRAHTRAAPHAPASPARSPPTCASLA